jgi:hypothetical protein
VKGGGDVGVVQEEEAVAGLEEGRDVEREFPLEHADEAGRGLRGGRVPQAADRGGCVPVVCVCVCVGGWVCPQRRGQSD